MKTTIRLIQFFLVILLVAGFSSCTKSATDEAIGTAEFSLNLQDGLSKAKSLSVDTGIISYQLMISVTDTKGNAILTDKLIPLYTFGTGFSNAKIEIKNGEYRLTKFMVINPSGAIVYATPLTGSPLAYLTNKPLPLTFNIFPGQVTTVLPEVLLVGEQSSSQFGYASFGAVIIKPLEFYTYCIIDNPLLMASTVMTAAKLTISNNAGWMYSFNLTASVNHLIIRGGSENYTFGLEKEGYAAQKLQFTAAQLLAATKEKPLVLKIGTGTGTPQVMYFQPGPELGKDAMISDLESEKNFGSHKYFEATYMTEPLLTVMRSNRSLIWFDMSQLPKSATIKKVVLRLAYDFPVPWDSTIFVPANTSAELKPAGVLQQIIEPWEETKVTWANQPKTTETNQIYILPFILNTNIFEIDVTGLFVSKSTTPLPNYGIMFKLNADGKFKGFRFASSDFTDAGMRPKLSVQYTTAK
jgi:hypothetical protein